MFKIPKGINKLTEEEVLELIPDTSPNVRGDKHARLRLIKLIYTVLGFDLPTELLLIQLNENTAMAVIATAGAGKTTFVQAKTLLEKLIRINPLTNKPITGEKILSLVYNTHNVKQLKDKQAQFVAKLKSCGAKGINIDNDINAVTIHAFCKMWILQYSARSGLTNCRLMEESQAKSILNSSAKVLTKKKNLDFSNMTIANALKLYNVVKESLVDYNDMDTLEAFCGIGAKKEDLIQLFESYDNVKNVRSLYDFSDMLIKLYNLLKSDEEVRTYIQNYYDYITADEVQDFSPVMMEILRLVKGEHVPIICIGDEDQSIYGFRGADIYNTLDFENKFPGGEVFSLGINRRCGINILNAAKSIIETNTLRFDKEIEGLKPGGKIEYVSYSTPDGQIINLCNRLDKMTLKELENSIICYRNKKSSLILADLLERKRIPFNVISGYLPFEHELYKHVLDVMDILYRPYDRECLLNLYKVTPISKGELYKVLGYNPKTRKWKADNELKHFTQYDYGEYNNRAVFVKEIQNLGVMSKVLQELPLREYFDKIFVRIKKYFWNFKMEINEDEELDNYYTSEVYKFFNVNELYVHLESAYLKRKKLCKLNNTSKEGITLSTFHGLKGLEYDTVFIIDLEDNIFPNFASIDNIAGIPDKVRLNLKECETRLFYVAMTRAKKNLILYHSENNPSVYIQMLKEARHDTQLLKTNVPSEVINMDIFSDTDNVIVESPNSFIAVDTVEEVDEDEMELEIENDDTDIDDEMELEIENDDTDIDDEMELEFEQDVEEDKETDNISEEVVEGSKNNEVDSNESNNENKKEEDNNDVKKENKTSSSDYSDFLSMTLGRL